MRPWLAALALALSLTARSATAQTQASATAASPPPMETQPGARVRLVAPGAFAGRFEGTVLATAGDTLVVARPDGLQRRVAVAALQSLEVSRGKSHALGARKGALWGAGVGAGLGALIAAAVANDTHVRAREVGTFVASMAEGGAIWGVAIGAVIGAERWQRASPAMRVGIAPSTRGVRLAVAWAR